jgi:hypothetical protein
VRSAAPYHPLGDQGALVLGHRPADLQQELVLRVAPHRPIEENGLASSALELLQEHHPLDVVARQAVGIGDQHLRDLRTASRRRSKPGRLSVAPLMHSLVSSSPWPCR